MTDDIIEAYSGESSVDVRIHRTTATAHHPSTVVLAEETLTRIGVRAGETVRLRTDDGKHAHAVAETGESTGLDVGQNELLADIPVFSELLCGLRDRVEVTPVTLPEANHFTVVPVDPTSMSVIEQCSVASAGLIDAVVHHEGIVEFQPSEVKADDMAGPYYAEVNEVCPEAPARVTANTYVDLYDFDAHEQPQGVLSSGERHELYTTKLDEQPVDGELRARLRERLKMALHDLRTLAERLPDDDFKYVFGDDETPWTTGAATDVMALCWLGLDIADKEPNWRVEQAIERALYARGADGEIDLRVTRQDLPSAATALAQFRQHGIDALDGHVSLDQLWASPEIDPYELHEVTCEQLGEDSALPPAELQLERLAYRAQARQFPMALMMDVSTEVWEE